MTTSRLRGKAARHFDIALCGVLYSVHVGVQAGGVHGGTDGWRAKAYPKCSFGGRRAEFRRIDHYMSNFIHYQVIERQEAQLSPSDRAMRLVSSNLANCHATVQKLLIRQVLTKSMV